MLITHEYKKILLVLLFLLSAGCNLTVPYTLKSKAESELGALRKEYSEKIIEQDRTIKQQLNIVIAAKDFQIAAASDSFYAADRVFGTIIVPTRTDLITNNYVHEGWAALGNKMPSYEKVIEINERLKTELDETKTSLADLKKKNEEVIGQNAKLASDTKTAIDKISEMEKQKIDLNKEFITKLDNKQGEIIARQNSVIELERARADDKVARQAQINKLSIGAGIIALLCLAGAIWSPVFKSQLGLFAGVAAIASVGILYVEGWHILLAVGISTAILVVWAIVKHNKDEKLSDGLVLAMQSIKNKSGDLWAQVSPEISEQLKKYVKKDGKIVAVEDPSMTKHIDNKLAEYQQK